MNKPTRSTVGHPRVAPAAESPSRSLVETLRLIEEQSILRMVMLLFASSGSNPRRRLSSPGMTEPDTEKNQIDKWDASRPCSPFIRMIGARAI